MAVVAHPDDETFGCGSLLLHAVSIGMRTAVVCATRGEAGEAAPGSGIVGSDLAAVRERELRQAADLLGVARVELLDFHDSGMSGPTGPATLVGAPANAVRDQVRDRVDDFRPTVVVTLDAADGHRDHARIRDATLAAVDSAHWQVGRVYLQCLPQSLMRRWVEHMARVDPSWEHLRGDIPGTPDDLVTTVIDTTRHLSAREHAMRQHASQRSPYESLPTDLRHAFLCAERLQRVRPKWTGGPLETDIQPSHTGRA
jgi:LmbE family N-acetylglucosaminyl deacetylase